MSFCKVVGIRLYFFLYLPVSRMEKELPGQDAARESMMSG